MRSWMPVAVVALGLALPGCAVRRAAGDGIAGAAAVVAFAPLLPLYGLYSFGSAVGDAIRPAEPEVEPEMLGSVDLEAPLEEKWVADPASPKYR